MNGAFNKFFTTVTIVFVLFLFVFFFSALSQRRQANIDEITTAASRSLSQFSSGIIPFDEAFFPRTETLVSPGYRVILVQRMDARADSVIALWSFADSYISLLPQQLSHLSGDAQLSFNDIYEAQIEIRQPVRQTRALIVSQVIYGRDIAAILRNILYFLLAFATFTILYAIVFMMFDKREEQSGIEYPCNPDAASAGSNREDDEQQDSQQAPETDTQDLKQQIESDPEPQAPEAVATNEHAPDRSSKTEAPAESNSAGAAKSNFVPEEDTLWPSEFLKLRLNNEIERSAENESDLAFIVFRLGKQSQKNEILKKEFEKHLLNFFRYEDLIFNMGKGKYSVILPNHDQGNTLKQVENFLLHSDELFELEQELFAGFSTRNGRLMGGERLFREAVKAAAMTSPRKGRIIGFKPDPQKYREHLMGTP